MICPLRLTNNATPMNQAECLQDRCSWWDIHSGRCAILTLACRIDAISEGVKK